MNKSEMKTCGVYIMNCPRCGRQTFKVITRNDRGDAVTRECNGCRTRICRLKDDDRDETYILEYPFAKHSWEKLEDYKATRTIWSVS